MYTHSKKTSNVVFHRLLVALLILTMTLGYSLTGFASVWADDTPVEVTDPAEVPDPEPTPDPATVEETAEDPAPEPEQELAPASAEASAEETTDAPITENALVAPMAVPEDTVVAPEAIEPPEAVNPDSHKLNIDYVRFVNETVGDPVHADRVYLDLVSGDAFNIASPAIAGFTIVGALVDNVRNDSILSGTKNVVGTMPNAERNVKVLYAPNPASYKVEYYFQKQGTEAFAGGEPVYELDTTVDKSGKVDTAITAADVLLPTVPVGYELSARQAGNAVFGTVALNNATVVKVYYDLKAVYVTFDAQGGSYVSPIAARFGDTIVLNTDKNSTPSSEMSNGTYLKTFYGWYLNKEAADKTTVDKRDSVVLNAETLQGGTAIQLYAGWAGTDKAVYRVAYWLEDLNAGSYTLDHTSLANIIDKSQIGTLNYGSLPVPGANGENLKPDYEGFALNNNIEQRAENPDGTYTLNVYYTRNTYTLEAYGWNWSSNSYVLLKSQSFKYGASLAAFWADSVVSGKTYSLTKANNVNPSNQWASGTLAGYPNLNGSGQYTVPVTMPDPGKIADDEGTADTLKVWDFLSSKNGVNSSDRYRDELYVYLEDLTNDENGEPVYSLAESRPLTHMTGQHQTAAAAYLTEQRLGFSIDPVRSDPNFVDGLGSTTSYQITKSDPFDWGYNSTDPVNYNNIGPAKVLNTYYTRNTTTVEFYANAADSSPVYTASGKYQSNVPWENDFLKNGLDNVNDQTFLGWYTNPGNIGNLVSKDTLPTFPAEGVTKVYAHWAVAELVPVTFVDTENNVNRTEKVYVGQSINTAGIGKAWTWLAPTSATKGFLGWFEADANTPFSLDGRITESVTLYARWTEDLTYAVHYLKLDAATGEYSNYADVYLGTGPVGKSVTEMPIIRTEDKDYFPTSLSQTITLSTVMSQNVITFYYTEQPEVAYATEFILVDENGDQIESLGRIDRTTRNDQVFIRALTLIGYDLHAKQDISTATWQSLLVDGRLTGGKVFTYKYVVRTDERPQPLSIIYDANGGTGAVPEDPTSYFPENTADVLTTPVPTRTAYTFGGWALTPNGSQAVQQVTFADRDITLYAIWTPVVTITTTDPEDPIIVDPQVVVTSPVVTPLVAPPAPAPAAPVAAPATVTTVEQDATPAATTTLPDGSTPLAVKTAWALFNLILTIVTVLIMVALLLTYFARRREDEELEHDLDHEERVKKHLGVRLISIAAAAIAIILFVRTEDMNAPMQLMDNWTVWHIVITAAAAILAIFAEKSYKAEDIREVEA